MKVQVSPEDLTSIANYENTPERGNQPNGDDDTYVIPLKPEPLYVVPADENTEDVYDDVCVSTSETNSPVYAGLDPKKRGTEDDYQPLVKFQWTLKQRHLVFLW